MQALIGICVECLEEIYCENGFFDGVHKEGKLFCNDCADREEGRGSS